MRQCFETRGYPGSILNRAVNVASGMTQTNLLQDKNKSSKSRNIPVYSTYSTEFRKVSNIVQKYLLVLFNDPIYAQILSKRHENRFPQSPNTR